MTHTRRPLSLFVTALSWAIVCGLALLIAAQMGFFTVHASHMLRHAYPLDYGEGPLLAQVQQLLQGVPIWALYRDPATEPFLVVNYPPTYLLATSLLAWPLGDALLAGRLVSLLATCAAVGALWRLSAPRDTDDKLSLRPGGTLVAALACLLFLCLPIVREWAVVMRVDMLGVALGLWALVLIQRGHGWRTLAGAVVLLVASLFTKPLLLAAPVAGGLWLLGRNWRRGLVLILGTGALGGVLFGLLDWASAGWFRFHVVTANANVWDATAARTFWRDQVLIHAPLMLAGVLASGLVIFARRLPWRNPNHQEYPPLLPVLYTIGGAITAIGVGKVGAYVNYFLEFYAGLVWLVAVSAPTFTLIRSRYTLHHRIRALGLVAHWLVVVLAVGAFFRYYPLWSRTFAKTSGLIEGSNPARLTFGRYGVWQDLQREMNLFFSFDASNAELVQQVREANAPMLTDIPGVAAQAGALSRMQMFEHRQLLDAGLWDDRPLLTDLSRGTVPLVVLDYLGNWMPEEIIRLVTSRYAQDGSRGTYDIYRPVETGPTTSANISLGSGITISGYALAPSPGRPAHHGGELLTLALDLRATPPFTITPDTLAVRLVDTGDGALAEAVQPLIAGALAPTDWPEDGGQHLHTLRLPDTLAPGNYTLQVQVRAGTTPLGSPEPLTRVTIEEQRGQQVGDFYLPEPLFAAWDAELLGEPFTPAVPFADYTQQCFQNGCLRWRDGAVERVPVGDLMRLADVGTDTELAGAAGAGTVLDEQFREFWEDTGGEDALGPVVSVALPRGDRLVQYTRYARLERAADGSVSLAPLGYEWMRLPGTPYRWPAAPPSP